MKEDKATEDARRKEETAKETRDRGGDSTGDKSAARGSPHSHTYPLLDEDDERRSNERQEERR